MPRSTRSRVWAVSLVSSNPQPVSFEVIDRVARLLHNECTGQDDANGHIVYFIDWCQSPFDLAQKLAEAGLLVTPQASSAERSEESLVSAIAESLRDFKFEVGPNTLEMLKVGQAVYLTPEERHRLAHAAANAYRQVMADE